MISSSDLSPHDLTTKNESFPKYQIDFIIGVNQRQFDFDNPKLQFFVKLKNKKYADSIWIAKSELESIPDFKKQLIDPFLISLKESTLSPVSIISSLYKPDNIPFDESFCCPETIISDRKKGDEIYYFIKWKNLGIEQSTWEDNSDQCIPVELINDYRTSIKNANPTDNQTTEVFQNPSQFIPYFESPEYKNGNKLTMHQLDGLNWLIDKWYNNRNSILADEHGNSKTVQCVTFTEEVNKLTGYFGPYLIITSLSTISKWKNEFKKWTNLRVLEYIGTEKELKMIYDYVLFADESKAFIKYDVIITSIEFFSNSIEIFNSIQWISIVVDKLLPQNLQNPYFEKLEAMCGHLIIILEDDITTYPIITVYSLFHLLESETFSDLESFIQMYSNQNSTVNIENFEILNLEYVLRRNKSIIDPFDSDLIKKQDFLREKEVILVAEPSLFQLELYRKYFASHRASFVFDDNAQNNLFALRKIANHPLMMKEEFMKFKKDTKDDKLQANLMVELSGKMIVLDKLIEKSRSLNQKVLVLSNMEQMVDLIELYLQKKNLPYNRLDGSNGEVNRTHKNGETSFIFLSSIGNFKTDLSETDTAIIYDSHFTPASLFDKKNIYRLFTRGTVEEDLFVKFTVKKDFSPVTNKTIGHLMRRNGYFAFNGEIDVSFFSEPIEKTIEYRTIYDFKKPENLDDKNFWVNLFREDDIKKIEAIDMDIEKLKAISKSILNYGCFETHNRFHQEVNYNFFLSLVLYFLYKHIQKDKRTPFKNYVQKVRKISKDLIVCKEIFLRQPFNNEFFVHELFGNDLFSSMMKIFSIDRIYFCLSFLSSSKINQIGFIFGQSMNIPVYWNDFYDYTLLFTVCMNGMNQSSKAVFMKNLEDIGFYVGFLPSAKYPFNSSDPTQINLPNVQWLKSRISIIVSEMEIVIPDDFFPTVQPLTPLEWTNFYRPDTSLHLETKNIIKRVLRFLYLFGFPAKKSNTKITMMKRKMNLDSLPDELITAIIYSLIKSSADLIIDSKAKRSLQLTDSTCATMAKSTEISRSTHSILIGLIENLRPIRSVDVSWVSKEAMLMLVKHLVLFVKVRELNENISKNKIPFIGYPKWEGSPKWWDSSCNLELIHAIDSCGFIYISCLKNLKEINLKLTTVDREEIKNFRIFEKKMLGELKGELPAALIELSFLKKIETRIFILQKLMSFLSVPSIKSISRFLPLNQKTGLIIVNIGLKNSNGYPIGYHSIRFYRGIKKNDDQDVLKSLSVSSQNSKNPFLKKPKKSYVKVVEETEFNDNRNYAFYSFFCMVKCHNVSPLFIIRNQDDNPTKFFEVRGFTVNHVFKMFKDTLLCKGIEFPPPYFDGYEFFGFRDDFVRSFISTA